MTNPDPTAPFIRGLCPACHRTGLFIGAGGFVTCSQTDCPHPSAAYDVLLRSAQLDPFPPDLRNALAMLGAVARHCATLASYEIRPYSPAHDQRRWRWQTRGCQRTTTAGRATVARLADALTGR